MVRIRAVALIIVKHFPHIAGFWSGWLPRAIGDVLLVTLTSGITFAVNKYLVHDREMAKYTGHVAGFITSSIVYPFTVVSNTIVVSRFSKISLIMNKYCRFLDDN